MRPSATLLAILGACLWFTPTLASAQVAIDVSPMVIEMKGPPGSSQHGAVTIRNSGHADEVVSFLPISWSVKEYGEFSIDRQPVDPDRNITPFLSLSQPRAILKAGETRTVLLALNMPQTSGRSYWGGYLLSVNDGNGGASAGATIVVYADPGAVTRHLRFRSMAVSRSTCQHSVATLAARAHAPTTPTPLRTCLVASFENDSDGYARTGAHLSVTRDEAGRAPRVIRDQQVTVGVVLPGKTHTVAQPLDDLPPGQYTLRLTLDYGADHVVDGVKRFTVK